MKIAIQYSLLLVMSVIAMTALIPSASASVTTHNAYDYFVQAGAAMDDKGDEITQALGMDGAAAAHVYTLSGEGRVDPP